MERTEQFQRRQHKASIFFDGDNSAILVAETPHEVDAAVEKAIADGRRFVPLTSGNTGPWNGRPLFLRADKIIFIGPPMDQERDD